MGSKRLLSHPAARQALDDLHDKGLNFDPASRDQFTPDRGWRVDNYCQSLPPEHPGPPQRDGSWRIACRLVRDYEFADPAIIRAIFHPERPLRQRDMLLQGRFYGLRFYFGVRVGGVNDETRHIGGAAVRVWGWNYRTLQGHLEMGQMDYEVWKWMETGDVEFRIHAFSRPATNRNPVIRLGFALFGRGMRVKFARHACARMERFTRCELARQGAHPSAVPAPSSAGHIRVGPAEGRRSPYLRPPLHRRRDLEEDRW